MASGGPLWLMGSMILNQDFHQHTKLTLSNCLGNPLRYSHNRADVFFFKCNK